MQLTYADIAVYNILRGAEFQFPDDYQSLPIPCLRAFKERVQERPNIAAYLKSDRCAPFSDSMSWANYGRKNLLVGVLL